MGGDVMKRIYELLQNILFKMSSHELPMARTTNNYVSATSFNRLSAYQVGNLVWLNLNLQITSSMPANTGSTKIGTITLPKNLVSYSYANLQPQSTSGNLLVTVQSDGSIYIQNASSAAVSGFVRATMILVM